MLPPPIQTKRKETFFDPLKQKNNLDRIITIKVKMNPLAKKMLEPLQKKNELQK